MKHITVSQPRRDGKFPIRIAYKGSPNMFGGFYPPTVFNKLFTQDAVQAEILGSYSDDTIVNNSYVEFDMPTFEEKTDENNDGQEASL